MRHLPTTVDRLVSGILAGASESLAPELWELNGATELPADVLTLYSYVALLTGRARRALHITARAVELRQGSMLEDATVLAGYLAHDHRFSSAVDALQASAGLQAIDPVLVPMLQRTRLEVLIRAASEADIPVLDTSTGRLLMPEDVRRDATQQVQAELTSCIERCLGAPTASQMARVLVELGARCGNRNGNWGHVFATVARTIDAEVVGVEGLLLPET